MEQISDHMEMLHAVSRPAFCVKDGIIVKVNADAAGCLIEPGTSVNAILETGFEEYAAFSGGCLYLNLSLGGRSVGCSVTSMTGFDLFRLEDEDDDREFRSMAVAAQALREPLSKIISTANLLFPISGLEDDPHTREQAARMNRGLMQLQRVINNMADACTFQSGCSSCPEIRDVGSVIDEIFEKTAVQAEHTGIQLHYEGLSQPIYSLVDSEKLERAILNIISNALKFTPPGGTIAAKLTRRGNKLYLSVSDSGCGIGESIRGNLFNRYERQPGLEDSRFGIGLGMVLIRAAAAAHGGTVLIDQPAGAGVRVTMSLEIRQKSNGIVRSPILRPDYAGEYDHALLELSDVLPYDFYSKN